MKEISGKFKVEKVNDKPVAEAIAEAIVKATEANDTEVLAELEALKDVDWNNLPFSYKVFATKEEAAALYTEKDILDLINTDQKTNAKSKEYQRITKALRPDPKSPDVKRASMIKEAMRTWGNTEEEATQMIDAMIAQAAQRKAAAEAV